MTEPADFASPAVGGNYIRDPATGALSLVPDLKRQALADPMDPLTTAELPSDDPQAAKANPQVSKGVVK